MGRKGRDISAVLRQVVARSGLTLGFLRQLGVTPATPGAFGNSGTRNPGRRLRRATGPGSYAEESPQQTRNRLLFLHGPDWREHERGLV